MSATPPIFICYRRSDTQPRVDWLTLRLEQAFGRGCVFQDTATIQSGAEWRKVIDDALAGCRVCLVVIGPDWLVRDDGAAVPRLWNDEDDVAHELHTALERGSDLLVVPVLIERDKLPPKRDLPPQVRALHERNHRVLHRDTMRNDVAPLLRDIADRLGVPQPSIDPPVAPVQDPAAPGSEIADRVAAYRTWARTHFGGLDLLGVGAGDVSVSLDDVYVPLRTLALERERRLHHGKRPELVAEIADTVELHDLLRRAPRGAVLLLGEPGSGKTTALRKLLHHCLVDGAEFLGLPADTVPFFVRMRRVTRADLDAPLRYFVQREVDEIGRDDSAPERFAGIVAASWTKNVLLLLDGLDEIADDALRADALAWLARETASAKRHRPHLVVSCRFSGLDGKVQKPGGFLRTEVKALDDAQIEALVTRWLRAARRSLQPDPDKRDHAEKQGLTEAGELVKVLKGRDANMLRVLDLISTPLFLTLLCVVKLRGGQIPHRRVGYFDECLRVLLGSWPQNQRRGDPPFDVEIMLALLSPIAWKLHLEGRRDDVDRVEFANLIEEQVERLGREADGFALLKWLWRDAGLIEEFTPHHFGFMHLGMQEYLAALHAGSGTPEIVARLAENAHERWWREVALLALGLPNRSIAGPFFTGFLAGNRWRANTETLDECVRACTTFDSGPFVAKLEQERKVRLRATLLRVITGRRDPRLLAAVRPLCDRSDELGDAARNLVAQATLRAAGDGAHDFDLLVLHTIEDAEETRPLAAWLREHEILPWLAAEQVERKEERWFAAIQDLRNKVRAAAIAVASPPETVFRDKDLAAACVALRRKEVPLALVILAKGHAAKQWSSNKLDLPDWLRSARCVTSYRKEDPGTWLRDARTGTDHRSTGVTLPGESTPRDSAARRRIVSAAGIEMILMPDDELWMAATPVTNAQYRVFVEATGHAPSPAWRDRRLARDDQPVVEVSWNDAVAFCNWAELRLPFEKEREYACRAGSQTKYWFGDDAGQLADYAWYDANSGGSTKPVAQKPANPWGLFDMHGNVWEWCADEAQAGSAGRVIRGGSWYAPAWRCRSSSRSRWPAVDRGVVLGFRPASSSLP